MKKYLWAVLFLTMGMLVSSQVIAGTAPGSGILQTSHDLSSATGRGSLWDAGTAADPTLDRVCIYCHAPHNTITAAQAAVAVGGALTYFPLWNHNLSQITTYTPYTNGTEVPGFIEHQLQAAQGEPGSVSKLCLSCHDGNQAVSSYGNWNPSGSSHVGTAFITNTGALGRFGIGVGGDLSNHHPIGFDYGAVAAIDQEIRDSGSSLLGPNAYGLTIGDLLWGGKVECSSCHDVHNTKNEGAKFLWVEDTNSNLCFSCHAK